MTFLAAITELEIQKLDAVICLIGFAALVVLAVSVFLPPPVIPPYTYHDARHRTDNRTGVKQHWHQGEWVNSGTQKP
jgi:hypothetical protein